MSRYSKVLNNRFILLCLMGLAGWLVVSESYMWWSKLSSSSQDQSSSTLQQAEVETAESADRALVTANSLTLSSAPSFDQVADVPQGEFEYGGSTTWVPLREQVASAFSDRLSTFQLQYVSPSVESGRTAGSGTGIQMLLDGELDFAQTSRPLKENEIAAAQQDGYALKQVAIAIDGIAVAVNPNLGVSGLTMSQLRQIYSGDITNWSELGGPDLKVLPYARRVEDSGTAEFFAKEVLEGDQYAPWVQFVENTTVGVRQVSENEGGIYYASAPEVVSQCSIRPVHLGDGSGGFTSPYQPPYVESSDCPRYRNQLNAQAFRSGEYPLTRELFVIVKENGEDAEEAGIAYASLMLTDEAQALIEAAGFVPIAQEN